MQLGMIGLGRMGANMVRRLMKGGHECVAGKSNANASNGADHAPHPTIRSSQGR